MSKISADTLDLREAWSAIIAIGLRPCSGALIVLTFALLNGLFLGGFLSVLAMSIGTAITVSILATLAVMAKNTAMRFANSQSAASRIGNTIEIAGAAMVLLGIAVSTARNRPVCRSASIDATGKVPAQPNRKFV